MVQDVLNFEVDWENAADARETWIMDRMHYPHPMPRLTQELFARTIDTSFGGHLRFVHGYAFMKNYSPPPPTPEIMERGVVDVWETDYVPRIAGYCAEVREKDYESLSAADLAASIGGLIARSSDTFHLTMVPVFAFMGPTLGLIEFSNEALGPDGPALASTILQARKNETAEAGARLAQLADVARGVPGLPNALRQGRLEAAMAVPGSEAFVEQFQTFLDDYGWRLEDWTLLHVPTWAEDPTTPLLLVGQYARDPQLTPAVSGRRSREQSEQARQEVESRLSGAPLEQFREMLTAAEAHVPMSEGRARWQLTINGSLRVPLIALGQKLVATGALDDANDVFYLSSEELESAAREPSPRWKTVAEERKAELQQFEELQPPPFLGPPPSMDDVPPEMVPVFRWFLGIGNQPSMEGPVIQGQPASRGTVRGTARVIRNLGEAGRLQPGEILVCETTAPPWTPLFAIAAGVVTDTGGVLSHSAICAREYAIPCVVGTEVATTRIRDGATITLDGGAGTVVLEDWRGVEA